MLDKLDVAKWLVSNLGGVAIDLVVANMDEVKDFLRAEAAKTTNTLDDLLVDALTDWLEEYLLELKDKL